MPTVQLNTRIDQNIKRGGDKVIKENGYTPTKVINLVWEYFYNNANEQEKIDDFFSTIDKPDSEKIDKKKRALEKMSNFYLDVVKYADAHGVQVDKEALLGKEYCKEHNIKNTYHAKISERDKKLMLSSSNRDLREYAYRERLRKYMEPADDSE